MRFGRHPAILGSSDASFIRALQPAAWFRADVSSSVTVTGQGISTLADLSGNGRDLLQSTDASRPPYLAYSGTKYLWSAGVASNTITSPTVSLTGNITIAFDGQLKDYTPAADVTLFSKLSGNNGIAFLLLTTGVLRVRIGDGASVTNVDSTVACGSTDDTRVSLRVDWTDGVGASFSANGVAVGTAVAAVKTLANAATSATIGPWTGNLYRAVVTNGGATTYYDAYPINATDAASTFVGGQGETWTVNTSGGLPAQIVGRASLLFDGSADYLKCNAFTLNQPETVLLAFKQVSWTLDDRVFDGNASNGGSLQQALTSPNLRIAAGSAAAENSGLAVGSYGVICAKINGASSSLSVNLSAATSGDAGANNLGGFTLGCLGSGLSNFSNIQVLEAIIFPSALSTAQITRAVQYLAGRHGIAL